jgi:hypothetical protein
MRTAASSSGSRPFSERDRRLAEARPAAIVGSGLCERSKGFAFHDQFPLDGRLPGELLALAILSLPVTPWQGRRPLPYKHAAHQASRLLDAGDLWL